MENSTSNQQHTLPLSFPLIRVLVMITRRSKYHDKAWHSPDQVVTAALTILQERGLLPVPSTSSPPSPSSTLPLISSLLHSHAQFSPATPNPNLMHTTNNHIKTKLVFKIRRDPNSIIRLIFEIHGCETGHESCSDAPPGGQVVGRGIGTSRGTGKDGDVGGRKDIAVEEEDDDNPSVLMFVLSESRADATLAGKIHRRRVNRDVRGYYEMNAALRKNGEEETWPGVVDLLEKDGGSGEGN